MAVSTELLVLSSLIRSFANCSRRDGLSNCSSAMASSITSISQAKRAGRNSAWAKRDFHGSEGSPGSSQASHVCFGSLADIGEGYQGCPLCPRKRTFVSAIEHVCFVPGRDITEPLVCAEHISPTSPGKKRQRDSRLAGPPLARWHLPHVRCGICHSVQRQGIGRGDGRRCTGPAHSA